MIKEYDNYIFDLYGTLVDIHTNEDKPYLWKNLAGIYTGMGAAYTPSEMRKSYKYIDKDERNLAQAEWGEYAESEIRNVFTRLFTAKNIQPTDEMISYTALTFRVLSRSYLRFFDGVPELIDAIHKNGKKAYLLSNAQSAFTNHEIKSLGIDKMMDGIVISSEEHLMKPDPRFMEILLDRYGLDREKSVMIGNERKSDIAIANKCKMDSIYIRLSGIGSDTSNALETATYEVDEIRDISKSLSLVQLQS